MVDDAFTACAEQLALNPYLVRQILVDHSADGYGCCRAHHGHREPHPCSIRSLAEMATRFIGSAAGPAAGDPAEVPPAYCDPASHCAPTSGCGPVSRRSPHRAAATPTPVGPNRGSSRSSGTPRLSRATGTAVMSLSARDGTADGPA